MATGPTAEIVWRPKILDFIQFQQRLSVMTPLALAREWARGEPGMGLYMGCLAIRQVKIWAAQLSSVQYVSGFSQAYQVDFLKHIMLCGSPSDFKIAVVQALQKGPKFGTWSQMGPKFQFGPKKVPILLTSPKFLILPSDAVEKRRHTAVKSLLCPI